MSRPIVIVDPLFAPRLRELRVQRGLSLRDLGGQTHYSRTYLWEIETGRKPPTVEIAGLLDRLLGADGTLADLVTIAASPVDLDDSDLLDAVAARPRSVDGRAVAALSTMLDGQRRLEDAIGSGPLVGPVAAHLDTVESLVRGVRGPMRRPLVDVAAQWAQFAGWLHANTAQPARARHWYATALEWATEIDDANMIATALSMRGHLAWLAGEIGPVIGLSQAAGRVPASAGVRSLAAQQEARGHALAGEGDDTDRLLDHSRELAAHASEHSEDEPAWIYFHNADYLCMQRGLAYRYLGRYRQAAELLAAGLAAIPPQVRTSEWVGAYAYQLGVAWLQSGEREVALAAANELDETASATGSARLATLARRLRDRVATVS